MSQSIIDESLYSRQLYVLGHEAMNKMLTAKVLLIGHCPLALEIAKNICLSGVHSLTLVSTKDTIIDRDLGCNYYFTESDIGKNCIEVLQRNLSELNPYVPIHAIDLSQEAVAQYDVVVSTLPLYNVLQWAKGKVILALINGFFSQIFCDFGSHIVIDQNGEECKSDMISNILVGDSVDIFTVEDHRHHLQVGDMITISEVQGLQINGIHKITAVKSPYSFSIDVVPQGTYIKGGLYLEVKQPLTINHKSFPDAMVKPEVVISDFAKLDRQDTVHCLFVSWVEYFYSNPTFNKNAFLPVLSKSADYLKIKLDNDIVDKFIHSVNGQCPPLYGVIGGIVAQEVLKKISNKFSPISQFFYFDALELYTPSPKPSNIPRYYYQSLLFGDLLNKIQNNHLFMVGSGAIGCELLKNIAMLGIKQTTVTDMDTIEKSNLNRQFLFRAWDVGKLKSATAKNAILKMNPHIQVNAMSDRVGKETENIFNVPFYGQLNIVLNALDNWEARRYMDEQCVLYGLPLLESGTLGTKGNIQVILPNKTESFTSSNDPQEESIPMCILHNFPSKIEHTIQWGRNLFEGFYNKGPLETLNYLSKPDYKQQITSRGGSKETVDLLVDILSNKSSTFEECVEWARLQFEINFSHTIKQLLYNFPIDATTAQGQLFWTGPKRAPHPLDFDLKNKEHFGFIEHGAVLRAQIYGITVPVDADRHALITKTISAQIIPEFVPKQGLKINTDPTKTEEQEEADKPWPEPQPLKLLPIEFEKDVDTNHHVQFITNASNLRAMNYSIAPVDMHTTKKIAGKIIPAIATTTGCVSGLVCLELLKVKRRN